MIHEKEPSASISSKVASLFCSIKSPEFNFSLTPPLKGLDDISPVGLCRDRDWEWI